MIHLCLLVIKASRPLSSTHCWAVAEVSNSFENIYRIKIQVHLLIGFPPLTHIFLCHTPFFPTLYMKGTGEEGVQVLIEMTDIALRLGWRRAGKNHLMGGGRGGAPLSLRLDPLRLSFLANLLGYVLVVGTYGSGGGKSEIGWK